MRARAASSRTKTATITAKNSDSRLHGVWALPIRCRSAVAPGGKCTAPSPTHTGAIHDPHDSLRRPDSRRCVHQRVFQLDHGAHADGRREVRGGEEWYSEFVRLVRLYQP